VPVRLTTSIIENAVTLRHALAASGVLTSALIAASATLPPPSATAHHVNGTWLCERKYDPRRRAVLQHRQRRDLRRARTPRGAYSLNWRPGRQARYHVQICAVTIRKTHRKPRFTSVLIRRYDDPKPKRRRDAGRSRNYEGPVVRRLHWSETIRGRARIGKGYCEYNAVLFPPGEFVPSVGTNCPGARRTSSPHPSAPGGVYTVALHYPAL
jgi:hypothetical protein